MYICIYIYVYVYVYMYMYICMYMYIYVYIYMYILIYLFVEDIKKVAERLIALDAVGQSEAGVGGGSGLAAVGHQIGQAHSGPPPSDSPVGRAG